MKPTRRKLLWLSGGVFALGLGCLAQAQVPMTGAGKSAPGAVTVCAGTPIILTSPNDLTNGAWSVRNTAAVANAATAPDSTNTASSLTTTSTGSGAFSQLVFQLANSYKTGGVTYSATGYLKASVTPDWVLVLMQEQGGFTSWGAYFNSNTGAIGNTGGTTCQLMTSVGSGWWKFSVAGGFGSTPGSDAQFQLYPCDSGSTCNPTLNQAFFAWQIGT